MTDAAVIYLFIIIVLKVQKYRTHIHTLICIKSQNDNQLKLSEKKEEKN